MNCLRVVVLLFLAFLIRPVVSPAQYEARKNSEPVKDTRNSRISVHELLIPDKARRAYNKGYKLLAAKEFAASVSEFQQAITAFPDFYEAYYEIGLADLLLHREEDAHVAFDKSIELSKASYAPPHFGLGVVFGNQKQFAEAEAIIRAGLDLDPTTASGHLTLAWVLEAAGRLLDAEKSARQSVLCDPKFATAYFLLAEIHYRLKNPSAVMADVDAFLRLAPDSPHSAVAKSLGAQAQQLLSQEADGSAVAKAIP